MRAKHLLPLLPALGFLILFMIYPLWMLITHSGSQDSSEAGPIFLSLFKNPTLRDQSLRSFNLALVVSIFCSLIAIPAALLQARTEFFGRKIISVILLAPLVVPPFVGAIGFRRLFARFGPINLTLIDLGIIDAPIDFLVGGGFWAVALVSALHLYPILYLNLVAAISSVDSALEDAARSVGAGPWRVFREVTWPMILPGFFAGMSLVFIWAFTDLGTPLVFDYREVLAVQIFQLADEIHSNPIGYALVTLVLIVSTICFALGQKLIRPWKSSTTIKGSSSLMRFRLGIPSQIAALTFCTMIIVLALLPTFGIVMTSISKEWFMSILPQAVTFSAYAELPSHPLTIVGVRNSLGLSCLSTFLTVLLGISIAWAVARIPGRSIRALELLTMVPLAVPGLVIAFGYLGAFAGTIIDPRNNPIALLVAGYTIRRLPILVRALHAGFAQCSTTLEQAAANLGAGPLRVLRSITLPLVSPHLIAGAIMVFCFSMVEVSESLILATKEPFYPLTKAMYAMLARPDGPMIASALGVVAMILTTLCLLFARKIRGTRIASNTGSM